MSRRSEILDAVVEVSWPNLAALPRDIMEWTPPASDWRFFLPQVAGSFRCVRLYLERRRGGCAYTGRDAHLGWVLYPQQT